MTTLTQTGHLEITSALHLEALKLWQEHTTDVLLLGANAKLGLTHALGDLVTDGVVSDRVGHFGQRKGRDLHDAAHFAFCLVYALGDVAETLGECFGLALEQVMADLCALELRLHESEGLAGRKNGLAVLMGRVLAGDSIHCMCRWRCTLPDMMG